MYHATPTFPHDRLDAYRVSLDLLERVHALCERIPRGYRSIADQMLRVCRPGGTIGLTSFPPGGMAEDIFGVVAP